MSARTLAYVALADLPGAYLRHLATTFLVSLSIALVLLDATLFGMFGPLGHGFPVGEVAREVSWALRNLTVGLWVVVTGVDLFTGGAITRRVFARRTPPPACPGR